MTMRLQRLVRHGTLQEVSVLSLMAAITGAGCFASAIFPRGEDAPLTLLVALGAAAAAMAIALLLAGPRVPRPCLHGAVCLHVGLIGVMVAEAVTERGLMLSSLGYVWTAVYAGYFFRPAIARAYAALMIVVLGLALLGAHAATDAFVWVFVSAMIWAAIAVISSLNAELRAEAQTDGLTGLLNRTGFAHAAARQGAISRRRGEPVGLAIIDLDDFKVVNDREGHAAGDRLLAELAKAWTGALRAADLLARFGGDEFVLMLPGVGEDGIDEVLDRLARAHPAPWTAGAVLCSPAETLEDSLGRADALLYGVKELRGLHAGAPGGRVAGARHS
jgi:GGDEF domain-containing protein